MNHNHERAKVVPSHWREMVEIRLDAQEVVLACFEPDLDHNLSYASGLVVLTDCRLMALDAVDLDWREWSLDSVTALRTIQHAGSGMLELLGPGDRLAWWNYTAARAGSVKLFVQRFESSSSKTVVAAALNASCPRCGAALSSSHDECLACPAPATPQAAYALLRVARFARPRLGMIALGLSLTLAATMFSLVPPYLTMPLLDKILIPHQNGEPVNGGLIAWYLAGLGGASILAWLLGWGRRLVMAMVSERVGFDLRNETYAHLQALSIDFYNGRRTGDLISRISSDSGRICDFLAINLVDFVTDVLMIAMTATILLTIEPRLALIILCPFPFIAWLVIAVRGHLRRGFRAWGEMTSVLADPIPGIRVVKAFAQESRDGRRHAGVQPVRAFPFSDSNHWVFIRDHEAHELLCMEDLAELNPHSRAVLESELARRDFVPVIQRIEHISAHTEPSEWRATTDRGDTRFTLNSEDDIRTLSEHRVLITDANGMRYVIADVRALDAGSRRLEHYI